MMIMVVELGRTRHLIPHPASEASEAASDPHPASEALLLPARPAGVTSEADAPYATHTSCHRS